MSRLDWRSVPNPSDHRKSFRSAPEGSVRHEDRNNVHDTIGMHAYPCELGGLLRARD
jgi:hypothetical protein